jgi:hypothetical protein
MKAPRSFKPLTATHPKTQHHILEDLNPQPPHYENLKYCILEQMLKNAKHKDITYIMHSDYCDKIVRKNSNGGWERSEVRV